MWKMSLEFRFMCDGSDPSLCASMVLDNDDFVKIQTSGNVTVELSLDHKSYYKLIDNSIFTGRTTK